MISTRTNPLDANTEEQEFLNLHDEINRLIVDQLEQDVSALSIAACLMVSALRLYRTVLTDDDYAKLVESIINRQNEVTPFQPTVLQ